VIMIAHRLSTVRDCDAIFVLDKGRVVESGSWAELVAGTGRFNRLWEQQSASS
jgi:ABC-type multidrug transport system fused ATPase/permease subunit